MFLRAFSEGAMLVVLLLKEVNRDGGQKQVLLGGGTSFVELPPLLR